jgi:hypothetical protein
VDLARQHKNHSAVVVAGSEIMIRPVHQLSLSGHPTSMNDLGAAPLEGLCRGRYDAIDVVGGVDACAFVFEVVAPVGVEVAVGSDGP